MDQQNLFQDPDAPINMTTPVAAPDMDGLPELTNALGGMVHPTKRAVAGARLQATQPAPSQASLLQENDPEVDPSHLAPGGPVNTRKPGEEAQLLSRWFQLVAEMQQLMSQMQALGMQPPPFGGAMQPPQQQTRAFPPSSPTAMAPTQMNTLGANGAPVSVKVGNKSVMPSISTIPQQQENPMPEPMRQTATPPASLSENEQMIALIRAANGTTNGIPAQPPRGRTGRQSHNNSMSNLEPAPFVALVEFKRQRIRRYEATLFVKPGEYVVVDGDRGTDCGFVVQCAVRNADGTYGRTESIDNQPVDPNRVKSESGRIHRVASVDEVGILHNEIASMERFALKTCRERVENMGLNMEIVDCEFQFDRKKVTFFFDSQESVDFRDLTKDLYRLFGSRIWLENINTKVKNVVPEGAMSHNEKLVYARSGLRAPR